MKAISFLFFVGVAAATSRPLPLDKAGTARWLIRKNTWGFLATTSVHLDGAPFGNVASFVDGTSTEKSTGVPYFYVSDMDTSQQDLLANPVCSFTVAEAEKSCLTDPQDPTCAKVTMTGVMADVTDPAELSAARDALFAAHQEMKVWPVGHGWRVRRLDIRHVWLVDFYGGAADIPVAEYFAAS
ncbi:unnamed protein product, partial [Phaeothamnion confervicola]